jgi:hypothetical protein
MRPLVPNVPAAWGGLPNSIRLIDPSMKEGEYIANSTQQEAMGLPIYAFNPDGEPIDVVNHYMNFGWEYVYHCHILSHEEMDMMHAQVVGVEPKAPTFISAVLSGSGRNKIYTVRWTDNSKNETAFVIERRVRGSTGAWSKLATVQSSVLGVVPFVNTGVGPGIGTRTYIDRIGNTNTQYEYRVYAINVVGDVWNYANPAFNEIVSGGFPTLTLSSLIDTTQPPAPSLAAPTNLNASAVIKNKKTATVTLTWVDPATNAETGFLVQRALNATFTSGVVNTTVGPNITTLKQDVARGTIFYYRVHAFDSTTQSGWSNTAIVTTP